MRFSLRRWAWSVAAFAVFVSSPADARCVGEWYALIGDGAPIATNGRIVLQGQKAGGSALSDLGQRKPVLRSQKDTVALRIVERRAGEMILEQALLEPVRPLLPNQSYRLDWDGRRAGDDLEVKTTSGADSSAPTFASPPSLEKVERRELGCGPAANAQVKVDVKDDGSHLVAHVELVRLRDGHAARGFVAVADGLIQIGHGMCGGLFALEAGARYEAFVTVLDSAGNATRAAASPVRFTAP